MHTARALTKWSSSNEIECGQNDRHAWKHNLPSRSVKIDRMVRLGCTPRASLASAKDITLRVHLYPRESDRESHFFFDLCQCCCHFNVKVNLIPQWQWRYFRFHFRSDINENQYLLHKLIIKASVGNTVRIVALFDKPVAKAFEFSLNELLNKLKWLKIFVTTEEGFEPIISCFRHQDAITDTSERQDL